MKNKVSVILFTYFLCFGWSETVSGQAESPVLKLEDIFKNNIYNDKSYGPVRWSKDSKGYLAFESNSESGGRDIVMYDAKTGNRSIICSARSLIPEGKDRPINQIPDARSARWNELSRNLVNQLPVLNFQTYLQPS